MKKGIKRNWIDLSEELTTEGKAQLKHNMTLGFKQEDGTIKEYKISRINHETGEVWAKPVHLYTEDELINHIKGDTDVTGA